MAKTFEACALAATLATATASLMGVVSDWTVQFAYLNIAEPMMPTVQIEGQTLDAHDLARSLAELGAVECDCETVQPQGLLAGLL
ncbi:hypothetical protein [Donghicola tyrosinivorans]|uniref:Uncharacterized protein n=1 Tax=Donghicola tyrosinivorans TaxID=1652492 RepID=A0A2T0WYB5_9RHOB|nr:hypothetical protein [Donghicola tyrosinivorans]PRY91686.1 hypothetical protein CLV74_103272 [Donghicola tyrosinivorans]